jgi:hypothetical protein
MAPGLISNWKKGVILNLMESSIYCFRHIPLPYWPETPGPMGAIQGNSAHDVWEAIYDYPPHTLNRILGCERVGKTRKLSA